MTNEQILEIIERYKLRIPPTVYYDLKADIVNCSEIPTASNDLAVDCISRTRAIERLKLNFPISQGVDNSGDRHRYMQALADIQAIRELPTITPQEPQTFKWCTDCREYDQEKHCCHRWSKVIRDTVEEMKQEQEPIKALGEELRKVREGIKDGIVLYGYDKAVAICNKYLSEMEDT